MHRVCGIYYYTSSTYTSHSVTVFFSAAGMQLRIVTNYALFWAAITLLRRSSRYVKSKCRLLVLTNQSVALWCYFMPTVNDLRPNNPTVFLQAQSALIHTNFKGERAPKKRDVLIKTFQQVSKNWPTSFCSVASKTFENLPPRRSVPGSITKLFIVSEVRSKVKL